MRTSSLARNAALNLIALAAPLAVAVVTLPVTIHSLGAERFGVLSIAWLLLTYLSELGFGSTTTYYGAAAIGAGREQDLGSLFWTTATLQLAVGVVIGAALALATPLLVDVLRIPDAIAGDARACLYLLSLSLPLLSGARSLRGLVEAAQRFDLALAVQVPLTAASYIGAAAAAVAGWSAAGIMGLIVIARLMALPAYYVAARKALPRLSFRPAIQTRRIREITAFASWAAVSTVVSPLLLYLDRFMIAALISMTAVTFYTAPYELVARLILIPGAVAGALFPAMSQLHAAADRGHAEQLAVRCITILVAVLAPVVVFVLGSARDILALWLGAEYASQSAMALQILAVGVIINAAAHVPYVLLHSVRRPDLPARFHLVELPVQLVLAWVLISLFGITGAALAWTARMVIDAALLFIAADRTHILRPRALRPQLLPVFAAALGTGTLAVIASTQIGSLVTRILVAVALALVCGMTLWLVAISATDRRRISALFRIAA